MLDDYDKIELVGFSEEAARIILKELNEQKPENVFELSEMIADLGASVCVAMGRDAIRIINVTGLYEEKEENEG